MNQRSLKELLEEQADLDLLTTKDTAKVVRKWLRIRRNLYARNGNFGRQREAITKLIEEIDGTFSIVDSDKMEK